METKADVTGKLDKAMAGRPRSVLWPLTVVYWLFPLVLAGLGYLIGHFIPAFRSSVAGKWPIDESVWLPLVIIIILGVTWLLFEIFWVFSRDTTSRSLQTNSAVTNFIGIIFSAAFGYFINSESGVGWWFVVPFATAVIDMFTTSWGAINNATQKPFMSHRGSE